jgi:hypothetical protein
MALSQKHPTSGISKFLRSHPVIAVPLLGAFGEIIKDKAPLIRERPATMRAAPGKENEK